jgi:GNAT superfamily N-acetyltransferase
MSRSAYTEASWQDTRPGRRSFMTPGLCACAPAPHRVSVRMLGMDSRMRDALPSEIEPLRALYRRSSLSNEGDRASLLAHPEALVWPDLALHERRTRVALRDGELVGFATTREVEDILELEDLFVDPDWMRRGVGRDLVRDALATATHSGVRRIEVTANEHALVFYERVGFVHDGVTQTRFGPGLRMHIDAPR